MKDTLRIVGESLVIIRVDAPKEEPKKVSFSEFKKTREKPRYKWRMD